MITIINCYKNRIIGSVFLITAFLLTADPAVAHKITVFAYTEGDRVTVESKFSGGRKVRQGEVFVSDMEGNRLLVGKTNDEGEFSFEIPKKSALKITVSAGMGHQGEWIIPIEEMDFFEKPAEISETSSPQIAVAAADQPAVPQAPSAVSCDEIQAAVEKALDKKLKPLMKLLNESRQDRGISLSDIFGGIGYIFGLAGIAAYFGSRRKSSGSSES